MGVVLFSVIMSSPANLLKTHLILFAFYFYSICSFCYAGALISHYTAQDCNGNLLLLCGVKFISKNSSVIFTVLCLSFTVFCLEETSLDHSRHFNHSLLSTLPFFAVSVFDFVNFMQD